MRLKDKVGASDFRARIADGTHEMVIQTRADLTPWQEGAMVNRPDMILQFAHRLAGRLGEELGEPVEIRVDSAVSLNGRPYRPMIDFRIRVLRPGAFLSSRRSTSRAGCNAIEGDRVDP